MLQFLSPLASKFAKLVVPTSSRNSVHRRPDFTPEDMAIVDRVRPYTMTSEERVVALIDAIGYLTQFEIPGAVVECGVWRGGSSMVSALALQKAGDTARELYLYDTFEGMTNPTVADRSYDGLSAADQLALAPAGTGVWCCAGLEEVRANLLSTGYPEQKMHFVQGRVEDTLPATAPAMIALLRLDTDWYESTKHELEQLYPRLVQGGILIIDDYGHWQGSKKATDEYFSRRSRPIFFQRLDYTGRMAVKF
jgi:O-methyltransferase